MDNCGDRSLGLTVCGQKQAEERESDANPSLISMHRYCGPRPDRLRNLRFLFAITAGWEMLALARSPFVDSAGTLPLLSGPRPTPQFEK